MVCGEGGAGLAAAIKRAMPGAFDVCSMDCLGGSMGCCLPRPHRTPSVCPSWQYADATLGSVEVFVLSVAKRIVD